MTTKYFSLGFGAVLLAIGLGVVGSPVYGQIGNPVGSGGYDCVSTQNRHILPSGCTAITQGPYDCVADPNGSYGSCAACAGLPISHSVMVSCPGYQCNGNTCASSSCDPTFDSSCYGDNTCGGACGGGQPGQIFCNGSWITPACSSSADCSFGQTCVNGGTCSASCEANNTTCSNFTPDGNSCSVSGQSNCSELTRTCSSPANGTWNETYCACSGGGGTCSDTQMLCGSTCCDLTTGCDGTGQACAGGGGGGSCGPADGTYSSTGPSPGQLCSSGTASGVSGGQNSQPYTWTCGNTPCSAPSVPFSFTVSPPRQTMNTGSNYTFTLNFTKNAPASWPYITDPPAGAPAIPGYNPNLSGSYFSGGQFAGEDNWRYQFQFGFNSTQAINWTAPAGSTPGNYTLNFAVTDRSYPYSASQSATLTVSGPTGVSLSPTSFAFAGQAGGGTPPVQSLTISNTSSSGSVDWIAATNPRSWCHLGTRAGTLNPGGSQQVSVYVDAPTSALVGTNNCTITVSGGVLGPQTAAVTYAVSPGDTCSGSGCGTCSSGVCGGGGGGGGNTVTATAGSGAQCQTITLSYPAGSGATSYNVYRNTSNSAPVSAYATTTSTSYTDNTNGGPYYYWVQSVASGGLVGDKVAANTNSSGGISANSCTPPPGSPGGFGGSGGGSCQTINLSWTAPGGQTGYYIYRNQTGTAPTPGVTAPTYTLGASAVSYADSGLPAGAYYYWIAAYNGGGNSSAAAVSGGTVAANACAANLYSSDKDIIAVNHTQLSGFASKLCNDTGDPLPSYVTVKSGDVLTFSVNICNDNGTATTTGIHVTDYLHNLQMPSGGWNMCYTTAKGSCAGGTAVTPTVSGSIPNQTLNIDLSASKFNVPPPHPGTGEAYLLFDAQIQPADSSSRLFQNSVHVDYTGGGSGIDRWTPLQQFLNGNTGPVIQEKP